MHPTRTIVAFCHLRWDFVYQRPQHLLSRLARTHRVVVVEEPVPTPGREPYWEMRDIAPNLTVYRPHTPESEPGFGPGQRGAVAALIDELRENLPGGPRIAWLYTPLAVPLARRLEPDAVVYDCMDELSLFAGASPELLPLEAELLGWADVVFTGGRSLYRAKRERHHNIHCFPSSVDAPHFRQARLQGLLEEPADQRVLPRPRLGFFGVLDERLDRDIVAALATAHPEWSIVLVGPVVKIDPGVLPRHPNLLYAGQRAYDELPPYLAGWDVCLLPFARNEATRFISPTKILEYMAAERPIVSTAITDVVEPYGDVVRLADTPDEFVRACEAALEATPEDRAARTERMRAVLTRTSWDATVASMERLVTRALGRAPGPPVTASRH
jgi:UDP-galactopyranose mutase